jgi:hypothetical protein
MTNAAEPVLRLWQALATRDWEAVESVVSDDCIFFDVPFAPALAARGPDDIVIPEGAGSVNRLATIGFAGFRPPGRQRRVGTGVKTERPQRSEDERS